VGDCGGGLAARDHRDRPSWWIVGRDLSEITASGFAYTAALLLINERRHELWRAAAAGALAVLCFYTRLNHLLWLFALIALLLPFDIDAGALWRPRTWLPRVPIRSAAVILASLLIGLALFAWRTWYYTASSACFTARSGSSWPPFSLPTPSRRQSDT
jgi:hypothetical protein